MQVEKSGAYFKVKRGESYFCFLVGSDKASWTTLPICGEARLFTSRNQAEACITELLRRNRERRKYEQQKRWGKCRDYLLVHDAIPDARKAAKRNDVLFDTSVWVTTLSKMLSRGEFPGCQKLKRNR